MTNPRLQWTKILPDPDPTHPTGKPCARSSHGVSWIQSKSRLVIHGGEHIAEAPLEAHEATWMCDFAAASDNGGKLEHGRWRALGPETSPPLRLAHAQASHATSSSVYVFGGKSGIGPEQKSTNDLWKLDCSGPAGSETWSEVVPKNLPPEARSFHKMVCLGDSLYVFGGCSKSGRLADLHRFDLRSATWQELGTSHHLKGRGGATLLPLDSGRSLGVVAGYAGEETNDGHAFGFGSEQWAGEPLGLGDLRPRSVCIGGSFPGAGVSVVFGGEVEPSAMNHEGAGGFENDIVFLNEATGDYLETIPQEGHEVPEPRGWSDGAVALDDNHDCNNGGSLFVFGGLSGDDAAPKRLDDLWKLRISRAE